MPTTSQVHVDRPLTDVSTAFIQSQDAFISMDAAPIVNVNNKSDTYSEYPLEAFMSTSSQKVEDGDHTPEIDYDTNERVYSTSTEGVHGTVGDEERANADAQFDLESDTTTQVTRDLMLSKERDWNDTFFGTGIWDTETDVGTSLDAWDTANGTPIEDITGKIETIEARTGFRPNTFISTAPVMRGIMNNDNVINRIKFTQSASARALRNSISNVLDVDNVFQARAVINSAQKGENADVGYVNGSDQALLCYLPDSPGLKTPSAMYTFSWSRALNGQVSDVGIAIRTLRDDKGRADWLEGLLNWQHKVISPVLGHFFSNALA